MGIELETDGDKPFSAASLRLNAKPLIAFTSSQ